MSRVRTKTVKKAAKAVINEDEAKLSKHDFQMNKQVVQDFIERKFKSQMKSRNRTNEPTLIESTTVNSKKMRNRIAGLVTHYLRRNDFFDKGINDGAREIKGIKLSVREEQRERRENYQPDVSDLDPSNYQDTHIDEDTAQMLANIGFQRDEIGNIPELGAIIKGDEKKRSIPIVQSRTLNKK